MMAAAKRPIPCMKILSRLRKKVNGSTDSTDRMQIISIPSVSCVSIRLQSAFLSAVRYIGISVTVPMPSTGMCMMTDFMLMHFLAAGTVFITDLLSAGRGDGVRGAGDSPGTAVGIHLGMIPGTAPGMVTAGITIIIIGDLITVADGPDVRSTDPV